MGFAGGALMKLTLASIFLGSLLASVAGPAFGGPGAHARAAAAPAPMPLRTNNIAITPSDADRFWFAHRSEKAQRQLAQLRAEGLLLQRADGGSLTAGHRAYLQEKLNAILTDAH
jgi:hypothetical protein